MKFIIYFIQVKWCKTQAIAPIKVSIKRTIHAFLAVEACKAIIEKIIKLRSKKKNGKLIPLGYFDVTVPILNGNEHYNGGGYSKRKGKNKI